MRIARATAIMETCMWSFLLSEILFKRGIIAFGYGFARGLIQALCMQVQMYGSGL
jgi:hypothetical protein